MFKVGQEVVCIDDNFRNNPKITYPKKNEIYKIRACFFHPDHGQLVVMLEEIINPIALTGREYNFFAWHFRATDSIFGEQVCESLEVMTEPELV